MEENYTEVDHQASPSAAFAVASLIALQLSSRGEKENGSSIFWEKVCAKKVHLPAPKNKSCLQRSM